MCTPPGAPSVVSTIGATAHSASPADTSTVRSSGRAIGARASHARASGTIVSAVPTASPSARWRLVWATAQASGAAPGALAASSSLTRSSCSTAARITPQNPRNTSG